MSLMVRSNFGHQFGENQLPVLDEIFDFELSRHPSLRGVLFNMESMDSDISHYSEVHDMPLFNEMVEGEEYDFSAPKQGASKVYIPVKFGLGFKITEEMIEDGKYAWIQKGVRKLAKSALETQEVSAMNVFNNAFGSETTADGVSLLNSAHTLPSGGTYRNILSTAADLSPTSLEQACIDFRTVFVGDSGIVYKLAPKILLVPEGLRMYAKELVGSELKPDSADNNLNSLKDEGLRVVSSPHLTDSDAWFLLSDPMDHSLVIKVRRALRTKASGQDLGFKDDSVYYKASYREDLGASNGVGVFGTAGA